MQVSDVSAFVIRNPPPAFGASHFVIVQVITADGYVGWGEMTSDVTGHVAAPALVADVADRLLVGHDPRRVEALWGRARSAHQGGTIPAAVAGALGGLEIACWDIAGKVAERPVHELLGGRVHDDLRAATALYPSAGWREVRTNADHAAARATNETERGFSALMFDVVAGTGHEGIPSQEQIVATSRMIATIRAGIGPAADLVVRAHGRYGPAGAARLVHELEAFDPLWIDQPCSDDRPGALAAVAASSSVPVAAGTTTTSLAAFASLCGAASVWRPDIGRCGGLLAGRKVATTAEAHGIEVAPVLGGGPILGAANIQLALTTSNLAFVEGIREWGGIHADLLTSPIECRDGRISAPSGPGLGVDIDAEALVAHAIGASGGSPLPPPPG